MSVLALPVAKLSETHNRSPLQGDSGADAFPGPKPWAVLLDHFMVKAGRLEAWLRQSPITNHPFDGLNACSGQASHLSLITSH
jgi:hypothetical protein